MGESGIKDRLRYHPLLIGLDSLGQELASGEFNNLWSAFDALPEPVKNIIASPEVPRRIEIFQKERELSDDHIEIISAIIREFILLERDKTWLRSVLEKNFEPSIASVIQDFITGNILTIKPEVPQQTKEEKPKTLQLPLLDAMGTYPRIGEQVVTSDRITVRGESGPVRGTVRNWLRAYRDALGVRKHTSMERGQFLFQSENTRRLPKDERMRLSTLLKSLDDKTPLDISAERQEIQFPNTESANESTPTETHTAPPSVSRPALSITPQQKLQAFRPVGDRLRIASARSQQENIASATNTPEEIPQQEEELSSAVYGDIASTPASEENGFRFSASHILPHERASELGIKRYQASPQHTEVPSKVPQNTASVGTDTFSPETTLSPKTEKQGDSPASRKNFGNLVNLRDS